MQPVAPQGFRSATMNLGLKDVGDDFTVVVSEVPARSAAVFTRSRFSGPSVVLSRDAAPLQRSRGMVVLSRNANVATGSAGAEHAAEVRRRVADIVGIASEELVIGSTGVIGRPYPMENIRAGLSSLTWPFPPADYGAAAKAIMTTDTRPKHMTVRCGGAVVTGIAKGVGMIEPDMATLLDFFFTDARHRAGRRSTPSSDASWTDLQRAQHRHRHLDQRHRRDLRQWPRRTGRPGGVRAGAVRMRRLHLVRDIASDGEGASKLIEVRVTRSPGRRAGEAGRQERSSTPRWSRPPSTGPIRTGAGSRWPSASSRTTDPDIDPVRTRIGFGDLRRCTPESPSDELWSGGSSTCGVRKCMIEVDLGIADGAFTVYGCDLTEGYVRINADYTT